MTSSIYSGYRCTNTPSLERCTRCNCRFAPDHDSFCMVCGYPREAAAEKLPTHYDKAYRDGYETGYMHGSGKADRLRALARNVIEWRQRYQEAHAKCPNSGPTANALALYELAAAELARAVMGAAK